MNTIAKAQRVKKVIDLLNLSQKEVATRMGTSQANISHLINGTRTITDGVLSRFALEFHVSKEWLFNGEGEMFSQDMNVLTIPEDTGEVRDRLHKAVKFVSPSQRIVAERLEIQPSLLSHVINGTRILSPDFLTKFANAFNININWLLTGEGDMEANTAPPQQTQQEGTTEIPLVPTSAMAGGLTGFSLDGVTQADCEYITSPIKGIDFAVPVYGESMSPEYPNGSRVLVQKINHEAFIEWGKVYVLDTCNGIVLKQVRKSEKDGWLSCYSINDNSIYAPFDVALKDVYAMYRVLMCLSLK